MTDAFEDETKVELVPPLDRYCHDWSETTYPVEVKMIYIRHLADVSTVDQSFKVAVGYDMMWPSTPADIKKWTSDPVNFSPEYIPNFEFPNAKSETRERRALENGNPFQIQEVDGVQYNYLRTLVYLTCIEKLELASFPFDVQELTFTMVMSFAPVEKAMFVPSRGVFPKPGFEGKSRTTLSTADFDAPMLILNREYCTIPDFDVERVVVQFKSACYAGEETEGNNAFRWSEVVTRIQIKRRSTGYIYRVVFYNILLGYMSICAFAIDPKEGLGDRSGFLITLILATVAFQFIVSQHLPVVSYLTILDKYTFAMFSLCCMLLGVVSCIGAMDISDEKRNSYDTWCLYGYSVLITLTQIGFFLFGNAARNNQMKHFKMGELELRKLNYTKKESPINLKKGGLLEESTKPMNSADVCAFVSFHGISDEFNKKSS